MTHEKIFRFAFHSWLVLWLAGLTIAQFFGAHTFGLLLVLLGIAFGGGALSIGVIVQAQRDQVQRDQSDAP